MKLIQSFVLSFAIVMVSFSPAAVFAEDEPKDAVIHKAAKQNAVGYVRKQLEAGVDVNLKGRQGWTPLHHAASNNAYEVAALLLQHGADVNAKSVYGRTPFWRSGDDKIATLLLQHGADVTEKDDDGNTFLHFLASGNADKLATVLLEAGADLFALNNKGQTPLEYLFDSRRYVIHPDGSPFTHEEWIAHNSAVIKVLEDAAK